MRFIHNIITNILCITNYADNTMIYMDDRNNKEKHNIRCI